MNPKLPALLYPLALLLSALACSQAQAAADPFAENIRPTPWLSPAEEQRALKVPEGFRLQLVASEPDINKPLNLAFDTLGRLWVTTSIEYPIPAPTNQVGRDRLMIFEDFDADGRARKITQFADGLNIPIGVYPFQSPNPEGRLTWKAVVWSIPHIYLLEDTDGDGRADQRKALYSGFDSSRDTHGNQASFRRGFDGWLYCTHGYNNDSHVKGADGHEVHLNSGNIYRIRLDGSRIEHHTHGQVNPFGLAFDASGCLFASDCHSEPLYQILAGGYYPSFGKPHDGLGFVPKMMENKRGATAIDGISIYLDTLWPEAYRGNVFVGDVMTGRVYRDRLVERGSSRIAQAMPDLIRAEDPWFRPVDTQLGPDGALYIADFYNRIIGHYEVPLGHPGRDRTSGRIWRLIHSSTPLRPPALQPGMAGALAELSSPNLTRRMLAMNFLADCGGPSVIDELRRAAADSGDQPVRTAHALWLLHRLEGLPAPLIASASRNMDRTVRAHLQRILGAATEWSAERRELAVAGLRDPDGLVKRCAAEALGNHPDPANVNVLFELIESTPTEDTHLLYVAKKALRDQLSAAETLQQTTRSRLPKERLDLITRLCLSVNSEKAAGFLLEQLSAPKPISLDPSSKLGMVRHVARYLPVSRLPDLAALAQAEPEPSGELGRRLRTFKALDEGLQQRGAPLPETLNGWGKELVSRFFREHASAIPWISLPFDAEPTANPWGYEALKGEDGRERRMISSRPSGEELTGVLRSPQFPAPRTLEFWLAGQDGYPDAPALKQNRIRLCVASSGKVLAESAVPQSAVPRRISWTLHEALQVPCYLEVIDGNDSADFAWIAAGGFQPALRELEYPEFSPRQYFDGLTAAAEIAVRVQSKEVTASLAALCQPGAKGSLAYSDPDLIETLGRAWLTLDAQSALAVLVPVLNSGVGPSFYRERLAQLLISQGNQAAHQAILVAMKGLPQKAQERLSYPLASNPSGAELLLSGMENGSISPRVLQRVGVNNRLKVSRPRDWESRVARLKAHLPAEDDVRDRLITEYKAAAGDGTGVAARGRQVFGKTCAICHRVGTEGALVGPQLDGIGQRGLDRLCEDILDPNRSVDRSFRVTIFTLKDQEVVSGLIRREEGELIVLADAAGKEFTVQKNRIADRKESETSLMPDNLGEVLPKADFADLMAFLLSTALDRRN